MNTGKICVSVCAETADEVLRLIATATDAADIVEIRFDCVASNEICPLMDKLHGIEKPLLVTFRPEQQGGKRKISHEDRVRFWDLIRSRLNDRSILEDHEFDLDLPADPDTTIISIHDFAGDDPGLRNEIDILTLRPESMMKVAVTVNEATDAIGVWKLLERTTKPVVPIAMGEAGKWTRILALAHGSPMTYASLDAGAETAPGQISARDLRDVFRVKELDLDTRVFGVIAGDTSYSLSPFMHNAAFRATNVNSVFVPLKLTDLDSFIRRMVRRETREVELNFRGFSVTNPHKQSIIPHLDHVDETAHRIGAVNTVKVDGDQLLGFNTDVIGFIEPLKKLYGDLRGASATVAGAGGAARACLYALKHEGCDVTVLARDSQRASAFSAEFGTIVSTLTTDHRPLNTDILVNATPLGTRGEKEDESIATSGELRDVGLVYDLVYNPAETRLIREARSAGVRTLGGIDMLIAQGAKQFEIWTGSDAPIDVMKTAITNRRGE